MEISCKELRARAWNSLKGSYWNCFLVSIITNIIGSAVPLILTGPMIQGKTSFYLSHANGENPEVGKALNDGFGNFATNLFTFFLESIFIFLWSLLLIIPAIIKTYSYAVSFFVITERPEINPTDAITTSKMLMNGYKWKLFKLNFSFIGWILLAGLTCGIGSLFLMPYMDATMAEFYKELKLCNLKANPQITAE